MRRSTLTLGMDATADVKLGEGPRGDGGVDELCRDGNSDDDVPARGLGGLPEPKHRTESGPWVLRRPEAVVDFARRQTAQTADAMLFIYLFTGSNQTLRAIRLQSFITDACYTVQ